MIIFTSQNINLLMKMIKILIAVLLLPFIVNAQHFTPDKNGYVADPAFRKLIKQRGYKIVEPFDTTQIYPVKVLARAYFDDNHWAIIDLNGKEIERDSMPSAPAPNMTDAGMMVAAPQEDNQVFTRPDDYNKNPAHKKLLYNKNYKEVTNDYIKFGVAENSTNTIIIPEVYDNIYFMDDNLTVASLNKKCGLFGLKGKQLTEIKYDAIETTANKDQLLVKIEKICGFIDKDGKEITPVKYNTLKWNGKGVPIIVSVESSSGNKYGALDFSGNEILPPRFGAIQLLDNNDFAVEASNKKWGIYNIKNNEFIDTIYTIIGELDNYGAIAVDTGQGRNIKVGLIDITGKQRTGLIYDAMGFFSSRLITVKIKSDKGYLWDKTGIIERKTGEIVLPMLYYFISGLSNNLAAVSIKNSSEDDAKWGFIDSTGKLITPLVYEDVEWRDFEKRDSTRVFYTVKQNGKWGVVNGAGNIVIAPAYDSIEYLENDDRTFCVKSANKYGVVDSKGKTIIKIWYDKIERVSNSHIYIVTLNGKNGIINNDGQLLVAVKYDKFLPPWSIAEGIYYVERNGKQYEVDIYGNEHLHSGY
jgi:hypothetical protein